MTVIAMNFLLPRGQTLKASTFFVTTHSRPCSFSKNSKHVVDFQTLQSILKIYIPHTEGVQRSSQQPFQTVLEAQLGPAKWNEVTKSGFNVCKGFKFGAFASIKEAYIS